MALKMAGVLVFWDLSGLGSQRAKARILWLLERMEGSAPPTIHVQKRLKGQYLSRHRTQCVVVLGEKLQNRHLQ